MVTGFHHLRAQVCTVTLTGKKRQIGVSAFIADNREPNLAIAVSSAHHETGRKDS
jgi:hypothetical protein